MNLTDTDSASLFFDFISKLDCSRTEDRAGYLFEILTETQILKWLESSDKFWGNFNVCSPTLKKKKNGWHYMITIAVNSLKNILKNIKIKTINKKHKGMEVTHESYAQRVVSLREYDTNAKKPKTMIQKTFQVKNTEMKIVRNNKVKFAGLHD